MNEVVMITGASSGIGAATARHLHGLGYSIVLGARRSERISALADELGQGVAWQVTDVCKVDDLRALAALTIERFGRIDALVNAAGVMPASELAAGRVEDWDRTIDTNLKGTLYAIHAVLEHMLTRGSGTIINIASISAFHAHPMGAVYAASKFGVRAVTEALRQEVSGKIRVSMICPGVTESELCESITVADVKALSEDLFRSAMPAQEIAEAVAFILSRPANIAVNDVTVRPLALQAF